MTQDGGIDEEALRKLRHDLSSPLMIVSGFAQLLAADKEIPSAERRDFASRIETAAEDLRNLVDEALSR